MSLKNLKKEELEDKFENFIFHLDDYLDEFIKKLEAKGYKLDYSEKSLSILEKYIIEQKINANSDDVNDASSYFGEVVRKKYGGKWICNLDEKTNSLYYGLPVITGLGKIDGVLLSPFTSVKSLIIRPRENHFKIIIDNHINPEEIDWTGFPDEDEDSSKEDQKPNKPRGGWSVFD